MLHKCIVPKVESWYEAKRLLGKMTALLDRGADPNLSDLQGDTPLHLLAVLTETVKEKPTQVSNGATENEVEPVECFWQEDLEHNRRQQAELFIHHGAGKELKQF